MTLFALDHLWKPMGFDKTVCTTIEDINVPGMRREVTGEHNETISGMRLLTNHTMTLANAEAELARCFRVFVKYFEIIVFRPQRSGS